MEITADTTMFGTSRLAGVVPVLRETRWGYVIRGPADGTADPTITAALRFVALVMVLSAYGQWLLPGVLHSGEAFLAKSFLSFALGLSGVTLYWFAGRRVRLDLHVDLGRRELRVAEEDGRGQVRLRRTLPMDRVEAAYVARPARPEERAGLFLTLRGSARPWEVARGPEDDILALHRRLADDLRPPVMRVAMKLARTVPFRSCRGSGPGA